MNEKIVLELKQIVEEDYRIFAQKLIPGVDNLLGVRIPALRKIAKRMASADYENYLKIDNLSYFEEIMLQGFVIGYIQSSWSDRLPYVKQFIPKINNWSICDSFCFGLKFKDEEKQNVWVFLKPYFASDKPYEIRFAVVMSLLNFVDSQYAQQAFTLFNQIKHDDYYVKMAIAWAVSIYFRDLPQVTMPYLKKNQLDDWTYNKALQKINESLKTDEKTKAIIAGMKRKIKGSKRKV